eukprot:11926184-Alexandrium_andersonii.AAC.1
MGWALGAHRGSTGKGAYARALEGTAWGGAAVQALQGEEPALHPRLRPLGALGQVHGGSWAWRAVQSQSHALREGHR